jgi:hypothetical protein
VTGAVGLNVFFTGSFAVARFDSSQKLFVAFDLGG